MFCIPPNYFFWPSSIPNKKKFQLSLYLISSSCPITHPHTKFWGQIWDWMEKSILFADLIDKWLLVGEHICSSVYLFYYAFLGNSFLLFFLNHFLHIERNKKWRSFFMQLKHKCAIYMIRCCSEIYFFVIELNW